MISLTSASRRFSAFWRRCSCECSALALSSLWVNILAQQISRIRVWHFPWQHSVLYFLLMHSGRCGTDIRLHSISFFISRISLSIKNGDLYVENDFRFEIWVCTEIINLHLWQAALKLEPFIRAHRGIQSFIHKDSLNQKLQQIHPRDISKITGNESDFTVLCVRRFLYNNISCPSRAFSLKAQCQGFCLLGNQRR